MGPVPADDRTKPEMDCMKAPNAYRDPRPADFLGRPAAPLEIAVRAREER